MRCGRGRAGWSQGLAGGGTRRPGAGRLMLFACGSATRLDRPTMQGSRVRVGAVDALRAVGQDRTLSYCPALTTILNSFEANGTVAVIFPASQASSAGSGPGPLAAPQKLLIAS